VARDFGGGFAKQVGAAPVGKWIGPVASGFGVHLVRVNDRTAPTLLPIESVRAAVAREWESDRRARASEEEYRKLSGDYDVVIEGKLP
jgi:parvulin-like peptidyl-prolyl isomerase